MGRAVIFLKDVCKQVDPETGEIPKNDPFFVSTDDTVPKPTWYPVKFAMDDPWDKETGASVLVSFARVPFDEWEFVIPADKLNLDEKVYYPDVQYDSRDEAMTAARQLQAPPKQIHCLACGHE
jgi:hypothetical protein